MQTQLRFRSHSYPQLVVSPWLPSITKSLQNRGFPIMLCYAKKQFLYGISHPWDSAESMHINVSVIQDLAQILLDSQCCPHTISSLLPPSSNLSCRHLICHRSHTTIMARMGSNILFCSHEGLSFLSPDNLLQLQIWDLPDHPHEEAREKQGARHFGRAR